MGEDRKKKKKKDRERVKEKANQLSTVSKRNAAQFYKYTRLTEEKTKTNLLWCYRYVADRDAWVERIERKREEREGECVPADTCHMAAQKA